jgi:glutaryl-CoA dehydrogenase
LACRELEALDAGLRSLVSVQGSLVMTAIHKFGSEEQRLEWLPRLAEGSAVGCFGLTEPDTGSDPSSLRTRAVPAGPGPDADWVLTGSKMWITNAPVADVAVIWARVPEGIGGFLVPTDTPGFEVTEVGGKLSLRASLTGQISLQDVRLPAAARLPGARGVGAALRCLNSARYGIAWGVTGALRNSLESALEYAGTRTQFGKPIAGFQLTQAKLADATAAYARTALLATHLGRLRDGLIPGGLTPELVSLAKFENVRTALEVTRMLRSILGGSGITVDYPPLRHALNLETVLTYEGTQEIHQLVVGRALTGLAAFE